MRAGYQERFFEKLVRDIRQEISSDKYRIKEA